MDQTEHDDFKIGPDELILVTGATGFIGFKLVEALLDLGFRNLRCFARPSGKVARLHGLAERRDGVRIEVVEGNLLSRDDCNAAVKNAAVIFHLAAGRGEKLIPDAFINSVVTTRNLLEASLQHNCLVRFVNISSFAVYTNREKPNRRLLDEACPVETRPELRHDAYCFAKVKQDEIVAEYAPRFGIPYVIVRPGYVFGPGNTKITGRVGIGLLPRFLHLGGPNTIPFTYVDNCAEAIAIAGLKRGIDNEVFNIVDDDLPSSREFLHLYKLNVGRFKSLYVPHIVSYVLCVLWEWYSGWSHGQLPPVYNRRTWHAAWKRTRYSNDKLKALLGWSPKVPMAEALRLYFEACRNEDRHA